MAVSTLTYWYRRHRLVYKKAPYKIANTYTHEQQLDLQQQFCLQLLHYCMLGDEVVFIDECTCNLWQNNLKTWQPQRSSQVHQSESFHVGLCSTRGTGVSVQGAISNKDRVFRWRIDTEDDDEGPGIKGNNYASFLQFIQELIPVHRNPKRTVYVMDNATYHHNRQVRDYILKSGVSLLFMPPGSSELNPIGKYPPFVFTTRSDRQESPALIATKH